MYNAVEHFITRITLGLARYLFHYQTFALESIVLLSNIISIKLIYCRPSVIAVILTK